MRLQTCELMFNFFLQKENKIADICTNFLVFLQEKNEIANMCPNFMVFLQEEN